MCIIGWFVCFTLRYTDRGSSFDGKLRQNPCIQSAFRLDNASQTAETVLAEGLASLCKLCVNQVLVAPPLEPFPPRQRSDRKSKWKTTIKIKTKKKVIVKKIEWHKEILKILWLKTKKKISMQKYMQ